MNQENKQQNSHDTQSMSVTKKPDSAAGLWLQAHVKITDVKTGEVLLKTRG